MNQIDPLFPVPAIEAVERELADIEKRLAELGPLQDRQAQLKTWLQLTRQVFPQIASQRSANGVGEDTAQSALMSPSNSPGSRAETVAAQPEMKMRILEAAERVYRTMGAMRSPAMLEQIEALGVVVRGTNKAGTVATILSKAPNFRSDREAGGWVLITPSAKE